MSKRAADSTETQVAKRILGMSFGAVAAAAHTIASRPERKRTTDAGSSTAKMARHAVDAGTSDARASSTSAPLRVDTAAISLLPADVVMLIMTCLPLADLLALLCAWRVGRLHAFNGAEQLFAMRARPEQFGIYMPGHPVRVEVHRLKVALVGYLYSDRIQRASGTADHCTTAELYTKLVAASGWFSDTWGIELTPGGPDVVLRIDDVISDAYEPRMRQLVRVREQRESAGTIVRAPLHDVLALAVSSVRGLEHHARPLLMTINNGIGTDMLTDFDPVRVKSARLAQRATMLLRYAVRPEMHCPLELRLPAHILLTARELARGAWHAVAPATLAQHIYATWQIIDASAITGAGAGETLGMMGRVKQDMLVPANVYTARAAALFYRTIVTLLRNAQASGAMRAPGGDGAHRQCRLLPNYGREDGAWSWLLQGMAMPMDNFNKSRRLDTTMVVLLRDADRAVRAAGVFPSQLVSADAAENWTPSNDADRPPNAVYDKCAWQRMLDTARYVIDWIVWRTRELQWCIRSLLCALVADEQPAAALAVCYAVRRPLQQIVMDLCPTIKCQLRDVMSFNTYAKDDDVREDAALFNTVVPLIARMHHAADDKRMLMTWAVLVQFELWVLSTVPGCHYIDTDVECWNMGQQQVARALVDVMRRLRDTPLARAHVRLSDDARQLYFAPAVSVGQ